MTGDKELLPFWFGEGVRIPDKSCHPFDLNKETDRFIL